MALKCYPLISGGLLAIQVLALNLTTPEHSYHEVEQNLEVILLLMFMVAAIYFMKPLLMFIFSKVFTKVKSKTELIPFICNSRCCSFRIFRCIDGYRGFNKCWCWFLRRLS